MAIAVDSVQRFSRHSLESHEEEEVDGDEHDDGDEDPGSDDMLSVELR